MIYKPSNLYIGYQKREDTFTGKLGYITYKKWSKLYKEASHKRWCKEELWFTSLDNIPRSWFILNKNIDRRYEVHRSSKIRIYSKDLDLEFEITPTNLLYILASNNVEKGHLSGEYIFTWDEQELVLMPTNSPDYKQILDNSETNDTLTNKDLVEGNIYVLKRGTYIYFWKTGKKKSHRFVGIDSSYNYETADVKGKIVSVKWPRKYYHIFKDLVIWKSLSDKEGNTVSIWDTQYCSGYIYNPLSEKAEELKKEYELERQESRSKNTNMWVKPKPLFLYKHKRCTYEEVKDVEWVGGRDVEILDILLGRNPLSEIAHYNNFVEENARIYIRDKSDKENVIRVRNMALSKGIKRLYVTLLPYHKSDEWYIDFVRKELEWIEIIFCEYPHFQEYMPEIDAFFNL